MIKKIKQETSLAFKYPNLADEWHPRKNRNLNPEDIHGQSNKKVWWQCKKGHEWENTPNSRVSNSSGCPYCSGRRPIKGKTDLATVNPQLAKEWHPTKNGNITAEDVKSQSSKKVWWQCEKGHEWKTTISNRSHGIKGCPYCSGQKVIKGKTDLATTNPKIAQEWHPTKNGNLTSEDVKSKSNKKVWWRCSKGHEWKAIIYSRQKSSCPYCSGKQVIKWETDLATVKPEIAQEWHPTKNGNLTAEDVKSKSNKKVWWRCSKGHEWQTAISNRSQGKSCPYCAGQRVIKGETDLATLNPELTKEWHPTKNGNLKPEDTTVRSGRKVWWLCERGHEWVTTVAKRSEGTGCPYCSGKRVSNGETDLATLNPGLAKEWHPTKNRNLKPENVTVKSNKKIWWHCEKNHDWEAIIANRSQGKGCPYCAGQRVIKGETDLATLNPELTKEWHPTKNGDLKPEDTTIKSGRKVWWQCERGHEWEATVASRFQECGCPYCAGQRAIKGETDLVTLKSELAKEWHPTRNRNLKPSDVTAKSKKKVW